MSVTTDSSAIRSFTINTPAEELEELRRRIAATRWSERELVPEHS
jgi:hypothetical protein